MTDPYAHPGEAGLRGPVRYLWWLLARQPGRFLTAGILSSLWMAGLTFPPYLISLAVDRGVQPRDNGALFFWVGAVAAVSVANALIGLLRHRTMTNLRMNAAFRTVRAVVGHATRLGAALPRQVSAGEVVTIGISDVWTISMALTIAGPGLGGLVAYAVVAVLLLSISPLLAIVVLAGVPVLVIAVGPVLSRMQRSGAVYRERQGALTARLVDIVGGLRVLNGLGGKQAHADRYQRDSAALALEGYRVGAAASWVGAIGVGLPALFLAVVTWLGARMTAQHEISIGDLVAVYGYVSVLVVPVYFFIEGATDLGRAIVCARRVIAFLRRRPDHDETAGTAGTPPVGAEIVDPGSGVRVAPGLLTALVTGKPADAVEIADRLARFGSTEATWGGVRLDQIAVALIRERVLIADNEADLFAGTVREMVSGRYAPDDAAIGGAIRAGAAQDVLDALPLGLDAPVRSQGGNLSGGQRQRMRLVRALLADAEVMIAVEPTSAVDSHTEAAMAEGLRAARAGRTTLISTTSPLVLDRADVVYFVVDGRTFATGTHADLLRTYPAYRSLVARGVEDEPEAGAIAPPPPRDGSDGTAGAENATAESGRAR